VPLDGQAHVSCRKISDFMYRVAQLRKLVGAIPSKALVAEARQLASLDPKRVLAAVAQFYDVAPAMLAKPHGLQKQLTSQPQSLNDFSKIL
jgi:hypothetical protein